MSARHLSARTIRRALDVLLGLPPEALGDLAERLIDQLDATGPDPDREAEEDACEAGECGGVHFRLDHHAGDPDDAEPERDDEAGPDDPGPWWAPVKGVVECCPVRLAAG